MTRAEELTALAFESAVSEHGLRRSVTLVIERAMNEAREACPRLEEAAQALEAERAKPMPGTKNADDRLLEAFLANVRGDGTAERVKAYQAIRRSVARLRRDSGGLSFTGLLIQLIKGEASGRGWL